MSSITDSQQQVQGAAGLPATLEAARHAFQGMLAEILARQDPASPMFTAFVTAAGYAADGRDAILFAPSLPRPRQETEPASPEPGPAAQTDAEAARGLASLCLALISRLELAAGSAASPDDRESCREAARSARIVHDLLTRTGR